MNNILIIGLGGFIGSVSRYVLTGWVHKIYPAVNFPIGTFVVNIMGCFMIGILAGVAEMRSLMNPQTRMFLMIGILGSFTTFSTFSSETFILARNTENIKVLFNVIMHVVFGVGAVGVGHIISRYI